MPICELMLSVQQIELSWHLTSHRRSLLGLYLPLFLAPRSELAALSLICCWPDVSNYVIAPWRHGTAAQPSTRASLS